MNTYRNLVIFEHTLYGATLQKIYLHFSIRLRAVVLKHRGNVIFTILILRINSTV
jgi:hypothetical protein